MDCESQINVNPEELEQQINLNQETDAQGITVDAEGGEQGITVEPTPAESELDIEQEDGEQCIFGGHECISVSGIASYTPLSDKPAINGETLEGDKTLSDLNFDEIPDDEVESIMAGNEPTDEQLKYLSQYGLFVLQGILEQLLDDKVDKEQGKGLSTNDYTTAEKNKLAGIEAGAEANVIEMVQKNGENLPITDKTVNVEVPEKTSELQNDSNFITSADIPPIPSKTSDLENDSGFITNANLGNYYTKTQTNNLISNEASSREQADQALGTQINNQASQIAQNTQTIQNHSTQISQNALNLTQEQLSRQNADNNLQSQIDAITAASDVVDIVGTYAELQNYDTSSLTADDIVKVLNDDHHDNATTYYRWNGNWTYIGSEGSSYTKAEADELFVPQTRTVNGQALDSDIEIPIPTVNDATLTIQQNGTNVATFTANSATNQTANITTPTKTSDLTNDSDFIDSSALDDYYDKAEADDLLADKQDTLTAGDNITIENNVISSTGGGGSATPLYSTLGENTDGAMTQKAVRESLYTARSMTTVRIGQNGSFQSGGYSVAIGEGTTTRGNYGTAVGSFSQATTDATAFGSNAIANEQYSTAIGRRAQSAYSHSIALGSWSSNTRDDELSIGRWNNGELVQNRFITGVADGVNTNDAATVNQLNGKQDTLTAGTNITIDQNNVISATGGQSITVDSALDNTSANPVENQVITNALNDKYDKTGGEITGNAKVDGVFTLDIEDEDYDAGINFTRTLDNNLGTTLTLQGYAGNTNYRPLLRNIATPNSDYDAANKKYVDDHILTPVSYLVALDQSGAIDLVSSSLDYATVKSYLTNNSKDVYLDVIWEPSRFYAKAVQDEDTNNGPVNFFANIMRNGTEATLVFSLASNNTLTVWHNVHETLYDKAQSIDSTNVASTTKYPTTKAVADYISTTLAPDIIYSDSTGLSPLQADISATMTHQLTNLDLSAYKRLRFHIGSAGSGTASVKSAGLIELELNSALVNADVAHYIGSTITENASDRNRLSAFLVAVDANKTAIAYARATSLYGTAASNISDSFVKLIEGFKY